MLVHINFQTDQFSLEQLRAIKPWYLRAIDFFYDEYEIDFDWVLMTRYHPSDTESKNHLTLRGFNRAGIAEYTMHLIHPDERPEVFNNGGTFGTRRINLKTECTTIA
ncbi:hypothetical protein NMY22_g2993 [Coprinellus aureogranulatus]|nr:hypothetical protein NMY22_g2993 [Coprinellus aureogranulatus]